MSTSNNNKAGEKVILFNYSGHGLMDLTACDAFLSGKLSSEYSFSEDELEKSADALKDLPKAETRKSGKW